MTSQEGEEEDNDDTIEMEEERMEVEPENDHDIGQAEEETENEFVIQFVGQLEKFKTEKEAKNSAGGKQKGNPVPMISCCTYSFTQKQKALVHVIRQHAEDAPAVFLKSGDLVLLSSDKWYVNEFKKKGWDFVSGGLIKRI